MALMRSGQLSDGVLVSSDMVEWQEADTMERILRAIPIDRERIIREFIEYGEAENPDWGWASDRMYSMLDGAPEIAWEIIVELVDRAPSEGSLSYFAAGPLEDLLSKDARISSIVSKGGPQRMSDFAARSACSAGWA